MFRYQCGQPLTNTTWCEVIMTNDGEGWKPEHTHDTDINPHEEHIAYVDQRYRYTDDDGINWYSEPHPKKCGQWSVFDGGHVHCSDCEKLMEEQYPQGWDYYPGDRCPHGKYTGGSGIDYMCQACEDE